MARQLERSGEGGQASAPSAPRAGSRRPSALFVAGVIVGLYAMTPGFYLAGLHVKQGAEVVDHVVPGAVVVAMAGLAIYWGPRRMAGMLVIGLVVFLAGFWMAVTHLGLLRQAVRHQVPAAPAAYHCSTALLVLIVGAMWVWRFRRA